MEENNQEHKNSSENSNRVKQEKANAAKKLAANLLQDEKNINFESLFKMADKLLKDESLMGLVEEIGKKPEEAAQKTAEMGSEKTSGNEDANLISIKKEMEALKADLKRTQKEVAELQRQNASLLGLYLKVVNAANQDLKKGVGLLTELSKLLK